MEKALLDERILTFNRYMKEKFGGRVARISFDTGFECPWGKCVYCRNDSFSPIVSANMSKDNWSETLDKSMAFLKNRYENEYFAAYFQSGTSTYGPHDKLGEYYQKAASIEGVVAFILSTRPDYLGEDEIRLILDSMPESIEEIWIELGLQSVHEGSLKWINRGHTADDYFKALARIEKFAGSRIKVAPHIILGIPGETTDDMIDTVLKSIENPIVKGVKLHHLQIHAGTELEKMFNEKPFPLLDERQYIELISKIISVIPDNIVLFRLFTTSPEEYLIAPKWHLRTQDALQKLEDYLIINKIVQGKRRI